MLIRWPGERAVSFDLHQEVARTKRNPEGNFTRVVLLR